jgi:O-acetyl-ADP-ribose deacetylase (regulator of RNase III)
MRNALHRADALDCESIATTVLGANTATYDHRKGARIVCETIDGYDPTAIEECRIVASGSPEYDRLSLLADEVLSVPDY